MIVFGQSKDSLTLSIVRTGKVKTLEALIYKGGNPFKIRELTHSVALIKHPKGTFAFDTGLGSEIEEQFHTHLNKIDQQLFKFKKTKTLKEQLDSANLTIDFIVPSHLHFDHASGINDFPGTTVWISRHEHEHAFSDSVSTPAFIKEQYNSQSLEWNIFDFTDVPYKNFAQSLDVFQDGTVILVPLYGHTKGSIGMFVNLPSGKKYFFIGDLTWAKEALAKEKPKFFVAQNKVDLNQDEIAAEMKRVKDLMNKEPDLIIVPAHDYDVQKEIAAFPVFE